MESKGTLNINSSPIGADILLNGTYIGKTPLLKYMVEKGTYILSISKDGFKEYTTILHVTNNTPINISVILTPSKGQLNVISNPTSAAVYVDGEYAGDTPLK
ncbi:PEGA domain-containing protein [Thermococcus indicus]|uniref:PEGA domain-containing protein n=1 Tax=Thermococcus indicus TaxID=2586643 RepID=A0A4Y5SL18_9EURY|nr:PEGA domain-containing protein [Thermococcus indicus]QDA31593.1 PEGA domain-containing protein [Thermococcus indicus]